MTLLAAMPRVVNQVLVTYLLLHVPLAVESECLDLDEFSSVLEPSEVSVAGCNKIIYAKPKLQSTTVDSFLPSQNI